LTGERLFDTTHSVESAEYNHYFYYAKNYIQISTALSQNHYTYGLGERFTSLRLKNGNYAFWAADPLNNNPADNAESTSNYYSSMPSFISIDPNTQSCFGAFILNSSPMQVELREKYLTYKMTSGILELFVFNGSRPKEVVLQMQQTFGKPILPPFSALGWNGYIFFSDAKNEIPQVLDTLKEQRMVWEGIWLDYNKLNSEDKNAVNQFIEALPEVEFYLNKKSPVEADSPEWSKAVDGDKPICIKNSKGDIIKTKAINNTESCFIDYLNEDSLQFVTENYITTKEFKFSDKKITLSMNEPSQVCYGSCTNTTSTDSKLPFVPSDGNSTISLEVNTLPLNSVLGNGETILNYHNLYAFNEVKTYYTALTDSGVLRPVIFSRGSFQGMQQYAGKWLGYVIDSWAGLKMSIIQTMNFNVIKY
jgi:alpha-glucosidase (family GH31 glycosyl hydrolase)